MGLQEQFAFQTGGESKGFCFLGLRDILRKASKRRRNGYGIIAQDFSILGNTRYFIPATEFA